MYNNELQIRNNKIKYRNWKVKDKNAFIKELTKDDVNISNAQKILVYDCLEDSNIALSVDEFRVLITQIRISSISDEFVFDYTCEDCNHQEDITLKISDVVKHSVQDYKTIQTDNLSIELGDIANSAYYNAEIDKCETSTEMYLVDFLYRIKKWNGNEDFSFDELVSFYEELDINTSEEVLKQWNAQKMNVTDVITIECSSCKNKEKFSFDEIPGFFPESWFE